MKTEIKAVTGIAFVYSVVLLIIVLPACAFAGIQLDFQWDPNPEPDIAGYRVFSRLAGQDYDYNDPSWEGDDTACSFFIDDGEATYFFVVRAYDLDGFESDDSNEAVYPDDGGASNPDQGSGTDEGDVDSDLESDDSNEGGYHDDIQGDYLYESSGTPASDDDGSGEGGCFIVGSSEHVKGYLPEILLTLFQRSLLRHFK